MTARLLLGLGAMVWLTVPQTAAAQPCRISVVVTALNRQNEPRVELRKENLRVRVGRNAAHVLNVEPSPPQRLTLLVDMSGSMNHLRPHIDVAVKRVLETSPQSLSIALVGFGDRVHVLAPFETSRDDSLRAWHRLPTATMSQRQDYARNGSTSIIAFGIGSTRLRDALLSGLDLLGAPTADDAILVVTDSLDTKSISNDAELYTRWSRYPGRLAVLSLFKYDPSMQQHHPRQDSLKKLVELGGGPGMVEARKFKGGAIGATDWLVRSLNTALRVDLEVAKPDPSDAKVSIRAQSTFARILHPKRISACD